jgi:hypothetical protein
VIDPQLRFFFGQRLRYLLHGSQRLLLAEIVDGDCTVVPITFEMDRITGHCVKHSGKSL